jgi:hypothetical protein
VRPVSAWALAAACCLFILPTIGPASAAAQRRGGGHAVHAHRVVPPHPVAHRGALHRGVHRDARFHRFDRHHGFAGGWPGYVDWGYAPFASGFVGAAEPPTIDASHSAAQVPVVVGIREAPAAEPAIIVVGRNGARVRSSKTEATQAAQYAASGPRIIQIAPTRR